MKATPLHSLKIHLNSHSFLASSLQNNNNNKKNAFPGGVIAPFGQQMSLAGSLNGGGEHNKLQHMLKKYASSKEGESERV